jgi:hypothetical protein
MSFQIVEHTLAAELGDGDTETVNYPSGYSQGDFRNAYQHVISYNGDQFYAPQDFTIALNASNFTITWDHSLTIPSGENIRVQLDQPGTNEGRVLYDGVEIPGAVEAKTLRIELGSPIAADADGLVASVTPAAGGVQSLTLLTETLDVPRNVTVTSAGDDSGRTFTVTGTDVYGKPVVEAITGANAGAAAGAKAFATVTSITTDDDTAGAITAGWGDVLGLPVFIAATGDVQRYEDGSAVSNGTLTAGVTDKPTATTGDVRGTWAPNTSPDGDVAFTVDVTTVNPGYTGATNYAG